MHVDTPYTPGRTVAVLGGGQLGTMLCTAAQPLRIAVHCLDPDPEAPARYNAQSFAEGEFTDRRTVEAFARHAGVVTIEIEAVSTRGLRELRDAHGIAVHPSPEVIELVQDKGLQKGFYREHGFPTADYTLFESPAQIREAVNTGALTLPFVQKLRRGGYDGHGVLIVRDAATLTDLLDGPSVVEALADLELEVAVVVARRPGGELASYPPVEMDFDPRENLVTQLVSPARIPGEVAGAAVALAERLAARLGVVGLLAVELFVLKSGGLWINEVAPRPHNSGHITMDGFETSQFEQHLRAILDLPLGSTRQLCPAVMVNLLGDADGSGPATYPNLERTLELPGVHVHLYGKAVSKPMRKMGHVNVTAETLERALELAGTVRQRLRASAKPR